MASDVRRAVLEGYDSVRMGTPERYTPVVTEAEGVALIFIGIIPTTAGGVGYVLAQDPETKEFCILAGALGLMTTKIGMEKLFSLPVIIATSLAGRLISKL